MKSFAPILLAILCIVVACYSRVASGVAFAYLIIGFIVSSLYLSMNIVSLSKKTKPSAK